MKLNIIIDEIYADGIADALATYNARPGQSEGNEPLTTEEFISATLVPQCEQWSKDADIAETSDIEKLKRAIKADPVAVKAAILAKEAREAAKAAEAEAARIAPAPAIRPEGGVMKRNHILIACLFASGLACGQQQSPEQVIGSLQSMLQREQQCRDFAAFLMQQGQMIAKADAEIERLKRERDDALKQVPKDAPKQ